MKNKTEQELIDLISLGENDKMEFKISVPSKVRDLSEEICAFANTEVREFFAQSGQLHFDAKIEHGYDLLANLDDETVQEFRLKAGISPMIDNQQMLENLDLFTKDGIPLAAGIMFFCKNVAKKYFQAVTRCVLFKGTDRVRIIDDKSFGGSLLSQYEKANSWIEEKLQVEYIIEGLGPRKEVWDIPLEVIREALVNALCHRDYYETGSVTMVEVFDDRVSITNPGGMLPIVQKNFGHLSKSRNPKIFELFTRMHLVEKVGSGIPRMIEAMKNAELPEPDLNYESEHFFITFKKRELDKVPNKVLDRIVEILTENPSITNMELGEMLEISDRMVRKYLSELKTQGKIERIGAKKNGYWKVV